MGEMTRKRTKHGRDKESGCEEEVTGGVESLVREEVVFYDLSANKELQG
jgi:hypothetical protein